jgi:hypothetical protein
MNEDGISQVVICRNYGRDESSYFVKDMKVWSRDEFICDDSIKHQSPKGVTFIYTLAVKEMVRIQALSNIRDYIANMVYGDCC